MLAVGKLILAVSQVPLPLLFSMIFCWKAVFSKAVKGSVVTAYEEWTMFSSHSVTSVSTLTTELAQTRFQTTRSLWQSLTKALAPNVLPGPNHLCANDPVVLPVSLRPVSTCDLRAVCTNLSSWGGQLWAVCFSFRVSKRNVLVLMVRAALFYGALPCSLHVLLVHGEQAESHAAVGYPCFACLKFCWTENCGEFLFLAFLGWKLTGAEGDLCNSARAVNQTGCVKRAFPCATQHLLYNKSISSGKGCECIVRTWAHHLCAIIASFPFCCCTFSVESLWNALVASHQNIYWLEQSGILAMYAGSQGSKRRNWCDGMWQLLCCWFSVLNLKFKLLPGKMLNGGRDQ